MTPNWRRAKRMTSHTVTSEREIWMAITTRTELEWTPKRAKAAATNSGYPGARKAVGPEGVKKGELKPWWVAREMAIAYISEGVWMS